MKKHPLRDILNRLKWTEGEKNRFTIRYVHRGAPNDIREILLSEVSHVRKGWFVILGEEDSPIPFHRVHEVMDSLTGEVLWRSRKSRSGS